jgi:dolichol-phosphate mannosyltransferase
MKLSVVIPAYNEQKTIADAVRLVNDVLHPDEILVVDDCSVDMTRDILKELSYEIPELFIVMNRQNRGHGESVMRGLRQARGEYVLYLDADNQIHPNSLDGIDYRGFDVVEGVRMYRKDKLFRHFISFMLRVLIWIGHGYHVRDANCPFKLYRRTALQKALGRVPLSYIIPIACLGVILRQQGARVAELDVYHRSYQGKRTGFLQSVNKKSILFCYKAFLELWEI